MEDNGVSRRRTAVLAVVIVVAVAAVVAGVLLAQNKASSPTAVTLAADPYAHAAGAVTVAGTGSPGFGGDGHQAVDAELDAPTGIVENVVGDLFIADTGNCRVREVAARSGDSFGVAIHAGDIATIAGGSCTGPTPHPATALALDPSGDLFIAFGSANRVEELPDRDTSVLGGPATAERPVIIAGTGVAGFAGDGGLSDRSRLDDPTGVAVDPAGDVLIADTANCRATAGSCRRRDPVRDSRGPGPYLHGGRQRGLRVGRGRRPGSARPNSGTPEHSPSMPTGTSWSPIRATGPSGCWRPPVAPSTACPWPPITWARWPGKDRTART